MRILFISAVRKVTWGGSEELWSKTALALNEVKGVSVEALINKGPKKHERIQEIEKIGMKIYEYDVTKAIRILKKVGLAKEHPFSIIKKLNPDGVIVSQGSYFDGQEWLAYCKKLKIPYCIITQAAAETWWLKDETALQLSKLFSAALKTYFVSNNNLQIIQHQLGTILENAEVVQNAFNLPNTISSLYPETKDGFILACVGRLTANAKGQDLIIQLMDKKKWRERDLCIHLYGKGENETIFKKLIEQKGLENVRLMGQVSDVTKIWDKCHGLLLPSRHEGLPLAIIEAMYCGRITISTNVAGKELIEDGADGFLCQYPTVESLDEALEKAWERRSEWENMGKQANRNIKNKIRELPEKALAKKIIQLFK